MIDVSDSLRLVHYVVIKYFHKTLYDQDYDDFVGMGNVGLASAAKNYNPEKGIQFSTFAVCCIINTIRVYLRHYNSKLPTISTDFVKTDNEESDLLNFAPCEDNYHDIENKIYVNQMLERVKLQDQQREIIDYMIKNNEWNQAAVGRHFGVKATSICRSLKRVGKRWRNYENFVPEYQEVASTGKTVGSEGEKKKERRATA